MPDFPIIDAHLHVYDPRQISYPWMADEPSLDSPHMPERFFGSTGTVEVEGAVFIEVDAAPGGEMEEARFIGALARREPGILGMVASLPLDLGLAAVEKDIEAFAAMPRARGIRKLIQAHLDEPGWCLRDGFVEAVRALDRYDLSFDLCVYHPQIKDVIALVERCPNVRFVLDHIAKPGIRGSLVEPWKTELAILAKSPNVWCKISGVVTEADHANWTRDEVTPYIAHALDCFGFDRVMFGGDWPVVELAADYQTWVDLLDGIIESCSSDEKRKLYRDNAIGFYRLDQQS